MLPEWIASDHETTPNLKRAVKTGLSTHGEGGD
jgi:hypothetical protein